MHNVVCSENWLPGPCANGLWFEWGKEGRKEREGKGISRLDLSEKSISPLLFSFKNTMNLEEVPYKSTR